MYRRRHKTSFATSEEIKNKVEKMRLDLFENPSGKTVASLAKEIGFSEPSLTKMFVKAYKLAELDKHLKNANFFLDNTIGIIFFSLS